LQSAAACLSLASLQGELLTFASLASLTMQTRSRVEHPFLHQFGKRQIVEAQNAKKRAAPESSESSSSCSSTGALTGRPAAAQQRQRGQRTEQKEANSIIVLDDEDSHDDDLPLQDKRRRLNAGNDIHTPTAAAAALRRVDAARLPVPQSSAPPSFLRPRRPLLTSIVRRISNTFDSIGSLFGAKPSTRVEPFSSTATRYTRLTHPPLRTATRSNRLTTDSFIPHTLSDHSWSHPAPPQQHHDDHDADIDRTFRVPDDRDFHDTTPYLTYPPHTKRHSVTVTVGDLHRLNPSEFLNDTLIEFYLLYIRDRVVPPQLRHRFHFFNSFLFTRLSEFGSGGVRELYAHVKGWTKGVNLFEKDWIVLPINDPERHHWSLVVIAHPGRAMRPAVRLDLNAAFAADRAKQKAPPHRAGGGVRAVGGRAANGAAGGQTSSKAAASSPVKAPPTSNTTQTRNGKAQPSIPELFAQRNSSSPPRSSLLALSSPPLTVAIPQTRSTRSFRRSSHGEDMTALAIQQQQQQQQQQRSEGRRATRSGSTSIMSPEQQTDLRFTRSKENILASIRPNYGKQQAHTDIQKRESEQWLKANAVPNEQPFISLDTQPVNEEQELETEEKSEHAQTDASADHSATVAGATHQPDGEPDVESADNEALQAEESSEQAAGIQKDADGMDIETGEPDVDVPILPRIIDSMPATQPLPSQVPASTSPTPDSSPPALSDESFDAGKRPCILHFDSLRIPPTQTKRIADILREYLQCEWEHQQQLHNISAPSSTPTSPPATQPTVPHCAVPLQSTRRFAPKSFPHCDVRVPQQPNDYDCGVYILHFAELFCREPWDNLANLRREQWFDDRMQLDGDKRTAIRALVEVLRNEELEEDAFEEARKASLQALDKEVEQKQQQVEVSDVFVPDSDDEEREQRQGRARGSAAQPALQRNGGERQSTGRRAAMADGGASGRGGSADAVSRSFSFVASSQPAEDEGNEVP